MGHIHILLVEDNEGDILLMNEALLKRPSVKKVSIAKNGQDGIDFVNKEKSFQAAETPDLIILDINLPLKNGYEVLKALKGSEKTRMIPIIVFTTSSTIKDVDKSYEALANLFVSKPSNIEEIEQAVDSLERFWTGLIKLHSNPD
ncbi:Response regulator receiver domain-containing protein [Algoriphagus alkaliphilus]|uniref:Response regulator receiver domain-containing protein n=1 Tax=Algoriphagus alkaliphilus TaxID=279824 RepID=A0A1G5Z7J5_9BACT|nr:response regulator [Algoriphagus alkaliphilus]MBA4300278.1 response regulator [Cyclobacterium sp.]SDA90724.1 Response regulator receiver domain-containing protein [Algoriphagus alkaliphilus]